MTDEHWADVVGYKNRYRISDQGRIVGMTGNVLKPGTDRYGYKTVVLSWNGKTKTHRVHRLVLAAFVGPDTREVNHLNGDKGDNRLVNLEYSNRSANMLHSVYVLGQTPRRKKAA